MLSMFCIQIAGVPIGIDNRYPYVREQCCGYMVEGVEPAFTVRVTDEEIRREQDNDPFAPEDYCEDLCIYRAICCRLARYDAFLMHSSVVEMDGVAYAFAAPSGTGKTTHTLLWLEHFGEKAKIVNGDKPVFRFIDGVLYACGTPWQGKEDLGANVMVPLQAVCFLEQGAENHIRRLRADEVSRRLFQQVFIPRGEEDFNSFWPLLERLLTTMNFYLLQCNRESAAAELAYQTMRKKPE